MVMQVNTIITTENDKLLQIIIQKKLLSADALDRIQKQAAFFQQTLFQHIMQYQCIDAELLVTIFADYFQTRKIIPDEKKSALFCFNALPEQFIKNTVALPLQKNQNQLIIIICNPNDIDTAKNLSFQMNIPIEIQFARYDTTYRLHNAYMSERTYKKQNAQNSDASQEITHAIFSDAIHRGASDIHFEPYQNHLRIRFRIDGLLHEITRLSIHHADTVISCIKILSQLDIAIKRLPQDGRLTFRSYLGFFKDCRVSACPTIHGEKIVIRLLDANTNIRPIHTLGLTQHDQKIILQSTEKPQGLILVTGPTGSGKTITLYTLLNLLNQHHCNISTIEDPVEMYIEGINQIPVNAKTGLTFSHALRALLRQDPDVMMLGEIRDQETAEMAIRAAQTGHLVFSTLHTNSAPEAITRLIHMNIAPFHLGSALTLIIAQRLVRKLCPHCKIAQRLSTRTLFDAGFSDNFAISNSVFTPLGCSLCTRGFSGRMGVFEILPINNVIRQLMLDHAPHTTIAHTNFLNGNDDLWHSGLNAVKQGITSLDEIYRTIPKMEHSYYEKRH